jgi:predicted HTH domain antitoxin
MKINILKIRDTSKHSVLRVVFALIIIVSLALPDLTKASHLNLGTLDISTSGTEDISWLNEYLAPGEKVQKQITISNFGNETKELTIYATDLELNENKNFFVKSYEQISSDLAPWIQLPTNKMALEPGESKTLSVNIITPKNAGVGLHTGAIIVRENRVDPAAPYRNLALEKGMRVYLNITGNAIHKSQIKNLRLKKDAANIQAELQIKNTGTVNIVQDFEIEIQNRYSKEASKTQTRVTIKPDSTKTTVLQVPAAQFGLYDIYAKTGNSSFLSAGKNSNQHVGTIIFIPMWFFIFTLAFTLALSLITVSQKQKYCVPKLQNEFTLAFSDFNKLLINGMGSMVFQRTAIYAGLITVTTLILYSVTGVDSNNIKTQLLDETATCKYEVTIKWGNLRKLHLPSTYRNEWDGTFNFIDAQIEKIETLDYERNDRSEIKNQKTTIEFSGTTGPDNDGLIVTLRPLKETTPILKYENKRNGTIYEIEIENYLNKKGNRAEGLYAVEYAVEYCQAEIEQQNKFISQEIPPLYEYDASGELIATPEANLEITSLDTEKQKKDKKIKPELQSLFMEELPATPDAMFEYIVSSDYVAKKIQINQNQKIEADPLLIRALAATPEILAEITSTPDLNFVFVPNETVIFPPITFSFDSSASTAKNIGSLIFVQNKQEPWNTYIRTTDFNSLSSGHKIPASAVELYPGEPIILGEFKIKDNEVKDGKKNNGLAGSISSDGSIATSSLVTSGKIHKFTDTFDEASLIYIEPSPGKKVVFQLNPSLKISIPANTPPGTYQGALTITSI